MNNLPSDENLMKDLFYVLPEEKEYLDKMEAYIQNQGMSNIIDSANQNSIQ